MNNRRKLFLSVGASALLHASAGFAQQRPRVWRIGILSPRSRASLDSDPFTGFTQGMRELSYVDGKNVHYEWRFADGNYEQLPAMVDELIQLRVDVLVTGGTPATRAAQKATQTIPIVMASTSNPVGTGLIKSLAHPGSNITGVSTIASDLGPKHLELLATALPKMSRVAVLLNPGNPSHSTQLENLRRAADTAKVQLITVEAQSPEQIARAVSSMKREGADALIVTIDSLFIQQQARIAELVKKLALPAIFASRDFVEAGGLMSYGANLAANYHRAAYYVDRILKGAKPGDIPIEQPMTFEFAVNQRTAKALGLTMPPEIMVQATRVIQ